MRYRNFAFILVFGVQFVLPAATPAAGPLIVNGAGQPLVWSGAIPYNPDLGTLGVLSNASAVSSVVQRFAAWQAVPTASVTYTNAGALPVYVTVSNYASYLGVCGDGLSPIIFDTDGSITDDALGVGASDSILGFAGPDCGTYVPPQITEGVAILNGKFIDGVGPTEVSLSEFESVFLHEFGHYANLDHSQVNLLEAFDGVP